MNGHSDHKLFTYNNKGIVEESIEIVPNEIIEFKGNRYCFDSYYKPYNGVREVNGKKYYFVNIDAWTYKGVHTIDGERYYFNENGQLAVNREDKEYISISFVDGYGIDRYLVSYDKDGKVKETKLIKPNQWIEFAGGKYYFNKNYDAYNGWQEIDGKMYFFDENKNEKFIKGTTFNEIYSLYEFDRELRAIIFKYTLQIENTLRTLVSHVFSKYHGVENYLRYSNFDFIDYKSASKKK